MMETYMYYALLSVVAVSLVSLLGVFTLYRPVVGSGGG